jgi:hypothetical protein
VIIPLLYDAARFAFAMKRANLESSIKLYSHLLFFFTAIVIVGIICEEADRFIPIRYKLDIQARRAAVRYRVGQWLPRLKRSGLAILVLGIAGEGVFEYLGSNASDALVDLDNKVITQTGKLTAQINERAGKNEREAAGLRRDAEKLKGENLVLRAEILRLRERMANRHLSASQRFQITAALLPFAGQRASFLTRWDDPEAVGFSRELFAALSRDAHWDVKDIGGLGGRENPEERGIEVDVSKLGTPARAQALVNALNHVGIAAHFSKREDAFAVDGVLIIVNSKP